MQQNATVTKVLPNGFAEVVVARPTACGHDCSKCSGCETAVAQNITAVARNLIDATVGARVTIEGESKKVFRAAAMVYMVPFLLFFLAYGLAKAALQWTDGGAALIGAIGFAAGIFGAWLYNKKVQKAGAMAFVITAFVDR